MLISGAGVFQQIDNFHGFESRAIANNSLVVSDSGNFRVRCISNSSLSGVGSITMVNGSTLVPDTETDSLRIINTYSRPGVIKIESKSEQTSEQGIYTCTIPDSIGNQIVFNFGLYSHGFMSKKST